MSTAQSHVAVPVFLSARLTRPMGAVQRTAPPAARFTKVSVAFRMSPASESYAESPGTAVMSWMVALSITVAVLDVADAVEAKRAPVYVTRASALVPMKSRVIERGTRHGAAGQVTVAA